MSASRSRLTEHQFAFYAIDIQDALQEASGATSLALRTKVNSTFFKVNDDADSTQGLQVLEAAQLYRVGRMIQELVSILKKKSQHF